MKRVVIPSIALFIMSLLIIIILLSIEINETSKTNTWLVRILGAFSASGLSVAIPGSIAINNGSNSYSTLAQKSPTITATGALAVFVIVYLFNPVVS